MPPLTFHTFSAVFRRLQASFRSPVHRGHGGAACFLVVGDADARGPLDHRSTVTYRFGLVKTLTRGTCRQRFKQTLRARE